MYWLSSASWIFIGPNILSANVGGAVNVKIMKQINSKQIKTLRTVEKTCTALKPKPTSSFNVHLSQLYLMHSVSRGCCSSISFIVISDTGRSIWLPLSPSPKLHLCSSTWPTHNMVFDFTILTELDYLHNYLHGTVQQKLLL